jgi:hypothetical protein
VAESVADDPKLAALWDAGQNPQQARNVEARSFRPAVWRCANGHTFQRSPRSMQNDASCPTCSKGVNTHTNLGKLRPALASLWDAAKNPGIAFTTLDATHANPVWWRCPNGHSFQRRRCACSPTTRARRARSRSPRSPRSRRPSPQSGTRPRNAIKPDEIAADHVTSSGRATAESPTLCSALLSWSRRRQTRISSHGAAATGKAPSPLAPGFAAAVRAPSPCYLRRPRPPGPCCAHARAFHVHRCAALAFEATQLSSGANDRDC